MQVFITGTPIQTAMALDSKRLNKQILEAHQILKAINGDSTAWKNHPVTLMYGDHTQWLTLYTETPRDYRNGNTERAATFSQVADSMRPPFHTAAYLDQMRRRLYTKNQVHYHQWQHLGTSDVNWYFVDGEWRYYTKGRPTPAPQDPL